jgi:hypothetical protein
VNRQAKRIISATVLAFSVAGLILVTVVLPAELGVDPLGTGRALGLLGLSGGDPGAITESDRELNRDQRQFELVAFESIELKYKLRKGDSLVFVWRSSGELIYDFHAEPDGAPAGYAESFASGRSKASGGTYVAQFSGIHGWFFENRGADRVDLSIDVTGFTDEVVVYSGGYPDWIRLSRETRDEVDL